MRGNTSGLSPHRGSDGGGSVHTQAQEPVSHRASGRRLDTHLKQEVDIRTHVIVTINIVVLRLFDVSLLLMWHGCNKSHVKEMSVCGV